MPDANGGPAISLQCLNLVHGPQDATYLAEDLPRTISQTLRAAAFRAGPGASRATRRRTLRGESRPSCTGTRFGYSGVLSGYFQPSDNRWDPARMVNPFGTSARLSSENTPPDLVTSLPAGRRSRSSGWGPAAATA